MQQPTLPELLMDACTVFEQPLSDIQGPCRKREFTIVRFIFCYVAYFYTKSSLKLIGKVLGNRDHTTIIHERDTVIDLIDTNDDDFKIDFDKYKQQSRYFKHMQIIRAPRKLKEQH